MVVATNRLFQVWSEFPALDPDAIYQPFQLPVSCIKSFKLTLNELKWIRVCIPLLYASVCRLCYANRLAQSQRHVARADCSVARRYKFLDILHQSLRTKFARMAVTISICSDRDNRWRPIYIYSYVQWKSTWTNKYTSSSCTAISCNGWSLLFSMRTLTTIWLPAT